MLSLTLPALLLLLTSPVLAVAAGICSGGVSCKISDQTLSSQQLAEAVASQTSIVELIMQNVSVSDWPPTEANIDKLKQLRTLQLRRVTGLGSHGVAAFKELFELEVHSEWPFNSNTSVGPSKKLRRFVLSDLRIKTLSTEWIQDLDGLKQLIINDCVLERIQPNLLQQHTPNLQQLTISNTNISLLENTTFGRLPHLLNLTLDQIPLQYLCEGALNGLPSLLRLSIRLRSGNLVRIWDKSLAGRFADNAKLQELRLHFTGLKESQLDGTFKGLSSLQVLDLSNNLLPLVPPDDLLPLPNLRELDLSNNNITCLYADNFLKMNSLKLLNLSGNLLRSVGRQQLNGLQQLSKLDLSRNPKLKIQSGAFCQLKLLNITKGSLNSWDARARRDSVVSCDSPAESAPEAAACVVSNARFDQSKHTFLIIIGMCVAFLIVTIVSMIAYKGWSRSKTAEIARDEAKETEMQAMIPQESTSKSAAQPRRHRQHQRKEANGRSKTKSSASKAPEDIQQEQVNGNGSADTKVQTQAQVSQQLAPADAADDDSKSDDRTAAVASSSPSSPPSSSSSSTSAAGGSKQQPAVTAMAPVPEDASSDARDVTTLGVM